MWESECRFGFVGFPKSCSLSHHIILGGGRRAGGGAGSGEPGRGRPVGCLLVYKTRGIITSALILCFPRFLLHKLNCLKPIF